MKKLLVATIALAAVVASPAFAKSAHVRMTHTGASAAYVTHNPRILVADGQIIGRDPDANVRLEMLRKAETGSP